MAKLSAHGTELYRFFCPAALRLLSVRSDGVTLAQRHGEGWKLYTRKRADVPLGQWVDAQRRRWGNLPPLSREITTPPTIDQVERWRAKGRLSP